MEIINQRLWWMNKLLWIQIRSCTEKHILKQSWESDDTSFIGSGLCSLSLRIEEARFSPMPYRTFSLVSLSENNSIYHTWNSTAIFIKHKKTNINVHLHNHSQQLLDMFSKDNTIASLFHISQMYTFISRSSSLQEDKKFVVSWKLKKWKALKSKQERWWNSYLLAVLRNAIYSLAIVFCKIKPTRSVNDGTQ